MRPIEYVVLERAKRLVEKGWTRGRMAYKGDGEIECTPFDPEATGFCMGGALVRAAADVFGECAQSVADLSAQAMVAQTRARELIEAANCKEVVVTTIERFNDRALTKDEVLAAFDRALRVSCGQSKKSSSNARNNLSKKGGRRARRHVMPTGSLVK
jgi:hypothetical protein